jgi:hypothetical protein
MASAVCFNSPKLSTAALVAVAGRVKQLLE